MSPRACLVHQYVQAGRGGVAPSVPTRRINAPRPPHSHIVDVDQGGWWEIEVIGVTDPAVWAEIAEGKDLDTVRELQDAGVGITGDIPSNLYLFIDVRD